MRQRQHVGDVVVGEAQHAAELFLQRQPLRFRDHVRRRRRCAVLHRYAAGDLECPCRAAMRAAADPRRAPGPTSRDTRSASCLLRSCRRSRSVSSPSTVARSTRSGAPLFDSVVSTLPCTPIGSRVVQPVTAAGLPMRVARTSTHQVPKSVPIDASGASYALSLRLPASQRSFVSHCDRRERRRNDEQLAARPT